MPLLKSRRLFQLQFGAPARAEEDPGFRDTIVRINRKSMFIVGVLGVGAPLLFILAQLFVFGKRLAWGYGGPDASDVLVVYDKLLMIGLGAFCLVMTRTVSGPRWGRLIVSLVILGASIATTADDIAHASVGFSAAYLALLMFASTTLPFRPSQTLSLCLGITLLFPVLVFILPAITGWAPVPIDRDHLVYLPLVCMFCTGISAMLYNYRYGQYRAIKREEAANRKLRETQAQLVQSGKMASLGNLVAGVAHEINTPLGAIHSNAELIASGLKKLLLAPEEKLDGGRRTAESKQEAILQTLREVNEVTLSASNRIDTIVRALRSFARLDEAERKTVDLHEGLESTLAILPQPKGKEITIVKEYGDQPSVTCHPNQINQVFMNLLQNAQEAIAQVGTITIVTGAKDNMAVTQIKDTGGGIPQSIRSRVFDPGFTTKGVGVGTGLGLAICYRIIENHEGSIEIDSNSGEGTTVTIRLPAQ